MSLIRFNHHWLINGSIWGNAKVSQCALFPLSFVIIWIWVLIHGRWQRLENLPIDHFLNISVSITVKCISTGFHRLFLGANHFFQRSPIKNGQMPKWKLLLKKFAKCTLEYFFCWIPFYWHEPKQKNSNPPVWWIYQCYIFLDWCWSCQKIALPSLCLREFFNSFNAQKHEQ